MELLAARIYNFTLIWKYGESMELLAERTHNFTLIWKYGATSRTHI